MSLPLVELDDATTVLVDVAAWILLSVGIGYAAHRTPLRALASDGWLTRLRPVEADGRVYERRLRIRRWKRWLPEGGDAFAGGFDKRRLRGRDEDHLLRFQAETRRAERVHWALLAVSPAFALWNRPLLAVAMVAFAVVANVPCLLAQRYNRARLDRLLAQRRRRQARDRPGGHEPGPPARGEAPREP